MQVGQQHTADDFVHKRCFRFQTMCLITESYTAQFVYLTAWPGIVSAAEVIWAVSGVWPNTIVPGSEGAQGVFGLGRIIHSPLKRIGESHRLWWVVSWCLFQITRTRLFVSQPGRLGTTTMSTKASWVTVIVLLEIEEKRRGVEEGKEGALRIV